MNQVWSSRCSHRTRGQNLEPVVVVNNGLQVLPGSYWDQVKNANMEERVPGESR